MLLESQAINECFRIIKKTEEHLDKTLRHFTTTSRSLTEAVAKLESMPKAPKVYKK